MLSSVLCLEPIIVTVVFCCFQICCRLVASLMNANEIVLHIRLYTFCFL
uniref:Uncharacterized protein n=1 Tax=Populus trichocarpa TaxID=3694 RepID=A9PDV4_POPTR|nr:unknown [Populus trichocarpa]